MAKISPDTLAEMIGTTCTAPFSLASCTTSFSYYW